MERTPHIKHEPAQRGDTNLYRYVDSDALGYAYARGVQAGDLDYDHIAFYAMMAARAAANESGVNWNAQAMVGTVFEIGNTRAYVSCAGGFSGDQDGSSTSVQIGGDYRF